MKRPNIYLFPQWDDNYGYLIKDPHGTKGVLVDPCDFEMCLKILELNDCEASYILLTHHHDDHVAAVEKIKKKFNSLLQDYKLFLEKNSSIDKKTQNDLLKYMISTLLNMID